MGNFPAAVTRRDFLAGSAAFGAGALLAGADPGGAPLRAAEAAPGGDDETVSFVFVSDTHYLADRAHPARLDPRSAGVTSRLIDVLNALPGETIPESAGGGTVRAPRGVIHGGDLIDTGDKNGAEAERMQRTEWAACTADFGLTGRDGRLKFPVYEVHGNHDGPQGRGLVPDGIRERNRTRPGVVHVSPDGLHCSWDWGPVHCVALGIVVGPAGTDGPKRRYDPRGSLEFLQADLDKHVRDAERPVVLVHHVDVARYVGPCRPDDAASASKEWNPCDVRAFYEAVRGKRVAAVLYGHTHARVVTAWDGESSKAAAGLPLYNVDNSAHFSGDAQAFFHFEIGPRETVVRECATQDGWRTHVWTPQVWRRPLAT